MKKLGISIYPEFTSVEEAKREIDLGVKNGFTFAFSNMLELKKTETEKLNKFKETWAYAKSKGMDVIVDVNPELYEEFGLDPMEIKWFKDLGATIIRLDGDFGGKVEAELSNNNEGVKIMLNASGSVETFNKILKNGANPAKIIMCHNWYPMRYTGLSYEAFLSYNAHYKALGADVYTWITLPEEQHGVGPWNVNNGMPTIEEHRDMHLFDQLRHLIKIGNIDGVAISQQGATPEQFEGINKVIDEIRNFESQDIKELSMEGKLEKQVYKDIVAFSRKLDIPELKLDTHLNRGDANSYFIRSSATRITFKDEDIKPDNSGHMLQRGDVVILNENLGRYKGELHIILNPVDDTKINARNLIGKISEKDMYKLDFVRGGQLFKVTVND